MRCLDDEVLLDVAEGRRALDVATEEHLAVCSECRRVLAAAARGAGRTLREEGPGPEGGEPSWDELGQEVVVAGRYVLQRFLGAGGMGVVWAARRLDDGAPVALKIARSTDAELRRRFEREARIAATLEHPNIARILDVVPATETRGPCLVQELISGESLEVRLVREGTLPLRDAARVLVPIASAVTAAHARGIVHRDLKPQNVLLATGRVVVLDFGIAKLLPLWGAHTKLTRTGAVLGTPRYMAPEQVFGEPDVDARADVWALGALLFRALAGRAPVEGTTLGHVTKELLRGAVMDLAVAAPGLPQEVLELVRAALVVPRARRFAGVAHFGEVLAPWM